MENSSLTLFRVTAIPEGKQIRKCIQTITILTQSFLFVQLDLVLILYLFVLHPLPTYITP